MTKKVVTKDANGSQSVETTGHPDDCEEPFLGTVGGSEPHSVTISNASGVEKPISTYENTVLYFDQHAHDYDSLRDCHDYHSHSLTEGDFNKGNWSGNMTIETADETMTAILIVNNNVATDPITNEPVNTIDTGTNNSTSG